MTGTAHVWIDTSMSSVRPPPHLGSHVDLDVLNDQVIGIQALEFSITFSILQELEQKLGTLLRPPSLGGPELFGLSLPAHASTEPAEGYNFLFVYYILQIAIGPFQVHVFHSLGSFPCVFEVDSQI